VLYGKGITPQPCLSLVRHLTRDRRVWYVSPHPLGYAIRARFFAGALGVVAFASVRAPFGQTELARRAMLVGTLVFAASTIPGLLHYVVPPRKESVARDVVIAEAIPYYGLTPGAAVASIGDGQVAYWAHLARVSVVAEVWSIDSARFWSEPPTAQQAVLHSMADAGAKAVIWRADSDQACSAEWISLPEHSGCVIFAALIYRATLSPLATLLR